MIDTNQPVLQCMELSQKIGKIEADQSNFQGQITIQNESTGRELGGIKASIASMTNKLDALIDHKSEQARQDEKVGHLKTETEELFQKNKELKKEVDDIAKAMERVSTDVIRSKNILNSIPAYLGGLALFALAALQAYAEFFR